MSSVAMSAMIRVALLSPPHPWPGLPASLCGSFRGTLSPQPHPSSGLPASLAMSTPSQSGASAAVLTLYRGGPLWTDSEGNELAKGTWHGHSDRYTPQQHIAENPWNSQWLSLTSDWTVACFFACAKKDSVVGHLDTSRAVFSDLVVSGIKRKVDFAR